MFDALRLLVLDRLGEQGRLDWSLVVPSSGREVAKAAVVGVLGLRRGADLACLAQQAGMRAVAFMRGPHSGILWL